MSMIKIIIADDHRLVRDGIKSLLKSEKDIEFIGESENGEQLIELLEKLNPSIILLDISMPNTNGIDIASIINHKFPEIGIIMLSMHEEPEYILKSVTSGASSYLLKNVEKKELIEAIHKVASGHKYFNNTITSLLALGLTNQKRNQDENVEITDREKEVLMCVANGLSTKLIADKLNIGSRTVETHRLNLLKKFNAQNTAELIKMALEQKKINL